MLSGAPPNLRVHLDLFDDEVLAVLERVLVVAGDKTEPLSERAFSIKKTAQLAKLQTDIYEAAGLLNRAASICESILNAHKSS